MENCHNYKKKGVNYDSSNKSMFMVFNKNGLKLVW